MFSAVGSMRLGSSRAHTERITHSQDGPDGLDFRCAIDPNDPIAVSTHAAIKSGLIDSCSFCFAVDGDDGQDFSGPDTTDRIAYANNQTGKTSGCSACGRPCLPTGDTVARVRCSTVASDQAEVKTRFPPWEIWPQSASASLMLGAASRNTLRCRQRTLCDAQS